MSFDDVYRKFYSELRRFGRQLNISDEKCGDLTQEVFMKYYIELNKGVTFRNSRAWLYKVFLNQYKIQYNSRRFVPEDMECLLKTGTLTSDLSDDYSEKEKQSIVFEMLDRLTGKDKAILLLYNHGLSYAEMADVLEMNPNSVGTTLVRAIDRLKEELKTHYNEMFEQS